MEGNLLFLLVLLCKVECNFQVQAPGGGGGGGLYLEGRIFGILRCTIVSHVTRPVFCWSAVGANSEVALQSETILIGNAWSFPSVISSLSTTAKLAQLVEHLPADWEVAGLHPRSVLSLPCKWVNLPVA